VPALPVQREESGPEVERVTVRFCANAGGEGRELLDPSEETTSGRRKQSWEGEG
jgi:hypothetical protein